MGRLHFFAFFIGAADITDRHFKNALFTEENLGGDFGLDAKVVAFEGDVFDDISKSILSFKTYVLSDPKRKCFNLCINPTEYIKIEESDAEQACAATGVSLLRHNAYARVHKAFRIMLDKKNDSSSRLFTYIQYTKPSLGPIFIRT